MPYDNEYAGVTLPAEKHQVKNRTYQGIPGLAVSPKGRIFMLCYTGGTGEGCENYVVLWISDDQGRTWSDPVAVVDPPAEDIRAFDSVPWFAPDGSLYLFWTQSHSLPRGQVSDGRMGVWFSVLENPDAPVCTFRWTPARRITDGVMLNAPIVCSDKSWLLPVSVWANHDAACLSPESIENSGTKCFASDDNGKTFYERGRFLLPEEWRIFDEHSFVELKDGRILCVARTIAGNAECVSPDGGRSWGKPVVSVIEGPNSRLFITRLLSGRLLLVNNVDHELTDEIRKMSFRPRKNMTAFLSDDDGKSWYGGLLLDGREGVSYPSGQQAADGSIWVAHDYNRYNGSEIIVSHFTEEDVIRGKIVSETSKLGIVSCKSSPVKH